MWRVVNSFFTESYFDCYFHNKALRSYIYIYICMLAIFNITAGPNWQKLFEGSDRYPGVTKGLKKKFYNKIFFSKIRFFKNSTTTAKETSAI